MKNLNKKNPLNKVRSLLQLLEESKNNLYSSKQVRFKIPEIIKNSGLPEKFKIFYCLKVENSIVKGINQIEVINNLIYSIKEDYGLLKNSDYETKIEFDRE